MHIYVEGKVQALEEYGEYVSAEDKAICCYIPVDEGHNIKIGGKFSGTVCTYPVGHAQKLTKVITDVNHSLRCRRRWGASEGQFLLCQDSTQPEAKEG